MKVVGFQFAPEDEATLTRLTKQTGWNRSKVVRELLAHAVVEGQPRVSVVLPAVTEVEEAHVG